MLITFVSLSLSLCGGSLDLGGYIFLLMGILGHLSKQECPCFISRSPGPRGLAGGLAGLGPVFRARSVLGHTARVPQSARTSCWVWVSYRRLSASRFHAGARLPPLGRGAPDGTFSLLLSVCVVRGCWVPVPASSRLLPPHPPGLGVETEPKPPGPPPGTCSSHALCFSSSSFSSFMAPTVSFASCELTVVFFQGDRFCLTFPGVYKRVLCY